MGGYGFLRFSLPMFPMASQQFAPLVFALSVIAIIYTSLVALAQEDVKKLIAYSSVAHMGFVTHGHLHASRCRASTAPSSRCCRTASSRPALFLCVGVVYDRMHTREIDVLTAASSTACRSTRRSSWCSRWPTSACPAPAGFIGEFLTLLGAFKVNTWVAFLATTGVILSAAYALYALPAHDLRRAR